MIGWLRKRFGTKADVEDFPSIVILLRESSVLSADDALHMCQAAWGAAAPVKLIAIVSEGHYVLAADPLFFAFHCVAARYMASPPGLSDVQRQCWELHMAWMAVDMVQSASSLRASGSLACGFKTLFYFVQKHWSSGVLALYFPCEEVTLPNQGDLIESIRWCRRNGIDLNFLK